ncbi:MAG: alanine--tRNA ligase, partial [Oscillospiraceae bacterium]|nr:alanine--tRNA ligase [Oscillospiraceae bacterium]
TDVLKIPADLLWPSVYEKDDEAFRIWHEEIGLPEERITRLGKDDNFWEIGAGPCGPCSEIYFDRGPARGCGKPTCRPGCDCDRYIEIWNNVFSEFNNDGNGNYTPLPQQNIDTGMGLERLACVMQDVENLFEVDTVRRIMGHISKIAGVAYGENEKSDISLRVVTDHIRSTTFLVCDGVLPSNEGRGYVLRRLLRRAAHQGKLLGVNEPFLYKVCDMVIHENAFAYPELREKKEYITRVIKVEEENFAKTIDTGMRILNDMIESHKAAGTAVITGEEAFKLYDTYGFPLDLTEDILSEAGLTADEKGFAALMQEQRERARAARGDMSNAWQGLDLGLDNTPTAFVGYDTLQTNAKVLAIVADGELRDEIGAGAEAIVVLDKSPFYAEMGGQVADHGTIGAFKVTDVQKNKGGKFLHHGVLSVGLLSVGDTVSAQVDKDRRAAIMRAHSATHLLGAALRQVLGDHVHQAGSLVEPDKLRFDFTHFSAMTAQEIKDVASIVAREILSGDSVSVREMPIAEARKLGAQALFGEKYGEIVRVVTMGDNFSVEFCGGTHVDNVAKIGPFRITGESSIASGVRRIEAVTGMAFYEEDEKLVSAVETASQVLKTTPGELVERIKANIEDVRKLTRSVESLKDKLRAGEISEFMASAKNVGGLKVITLSRQGLSTDELRKIGDEIKSRDEAVVAVVAGVDADKLTFQAVCGPKAIEKGVKAGDIIRQVTAMCGGKGGGRPDSAMGGGKDVLMLDNALAIVDNYVALKLGVN